MEDTWDCIVVGVEPDARMAALARSHGVTVDVCPFEDWKPGDRHFDVVISAFDQIDVVAASAGAAQPRVLPVVERSQRNAPEVRSRFNNLFLLDGASLGQYLKLINQLVQVRTP